MMALAFTWTAPAVIAGAKTCTRRPWNPSYAGHFRAGQRVYALDRGYRNGGVRIAVIELEREPSWQPLSVMPDDDYHAEGFGWLHRHPDALKGGGGLVGDASWESFLAWRNSGESMWTVRFRLVSVEPSPPLPAWLAPWRLLDFAEQALPLPAPEAC